MIYAENENVSEETALRVLAFSSACIKRNKMHFNSIQIHLAIFPVLCYHSSIFFFFFCMREWLESEISHADITLKLSGNTGLALI